MNKSIFRTASTFLCTLGVLAGCGGGNGDSGSGTSQPVSIFPKDMAFESLDGVTGQISTSPPPARDTPFLDSTVKGYAVALYKVIQTDAEAAPIKALLGDSSRYIPPAGTGKLLLLTQPDYFTTKSLVMFDFITLDVTNAQFRLIHLIEQSNRIEATLEVCTTRKNIMESQAATPVGYFAIAKTSKPVVILPLQFSPLPPYNNGAIGACSAS